MKLNNMEEIEDDLSLRNGKFKVGDLVRVKEGIRRFDYGISPEMEQAHKFRISGELTHASNDDRARVRYPHSIDEWSYAYSEIEVV